jgi:CBS domain-containing protein
MQMEIGPLTTRAVLTVDENDTLREAAMAMMERGVGSAVVMGESGPTAIITDRDTVRAVAEGVDGGATPISDYLSRKLTTAPPTMEVREAARMMRDRGFRHLVVVDENGRLYGVFSMRDLVVGLLQEIAMGAVSVESG